MKRSELFKLRFSLTEHHLPASQSSSMSWQPSVELGASSLSSAGHSTIDPTRSHNKENDVEEMNSSDSSSSSSSDE